MAEVLVKTKNAGIIVEADAGTPVAVDLSDWAGYYVKIYCLAQDCYFNFAASDETPALNYDTVTTGAEADVADALEAGPRGVQTVVDPNEPFLILEPASGTGVGIIIKPKSDANSGG